MKLSKTSWALLIIGILTIACVSLGVARSQQLNERKQLNKELSVAELRLNKLQLEELSSRQEQLGKQLSQTTSQLNTVKAKLTQPIESIAASDTLFNTAELCGVEITEISSPGSASNNLEGLACSAIPLTVSVDGDIPNLISFIIKLHDDFTTGVVKSVDISVSENVTKKRSSANIQLVIYTYQGE